MKSRPTKSGMGTAYEGRGGWLASVDPASSPLVNERTAGCSRKIVHPGDEITLLRMRGLLLVMYDNAPEKLCGLFILMEE